MVVSFVNPMSRTGPHTNRHIKICRVSDMAKALPPPNTLTIRYIIFLFKCFSPPVQNGTGTITTFSFAHYQQILTLKRSVGLRNIYIARKKSVFLYLGILVNAVLNAWGGPPGMEEERR